jgi:ribosomal protein S18 acetylase RimI-like enzyme
MKDTDLIGLNVHSENIAAIRCYESVGFEAVYDFSEMMLER